MSYEYNLRDYLPEYLANDQDYGIFIDILQNVANDIKYFVDNFNDLIDIDTVPEMFLPKLSYLLSYQYKYQVNTTYQRELIKRMIEVYRNKGTDKDIIDAANNGANDGWLGNKYFYPGSTYFNNEATISYPADHLFRHSVSKFSGQDHFPDNDYWRQGVIIIEVAYYTSKLDDAVKNVIPAGVRFYFIINNQMDGDGPNGEVEIGRWVLHHEFVITYHPKITDFTSGAGLSDGAFNTGHRYLSGDRLIFPWLEKYIENTWYLDRPVSNYKSNIFPVKEVGKYKAPESGIDTQWGVAVYRTVTDSLDGGEVTNNDVIVDSGSIMDYDDYTVGGINLSLYDTEVPPDSDLPLDDPKYFDIKQNSNGDILVAADESFPVSLLDAPRYFSIKQADNGDILIAANNSFPSDGDKPVVNPVDPDDKDRYKSINLLSGKLK